MEEIVKLARKAIETWVREKKRIKVEGGEKRGVFVTILTYPEKELRGCIGYPFPVKTLKEAVVDVAIEATMDPRFEPLKEEELDHIIVEVTILGPLKKLEGEARQFPKKIVIGKHGLYIEKGFFSGLLLPQVPVEFGWDAEEFLCQACLKAGLEPTAWLDHDTKVYVFEGEIWREERPKGQIKKITLTSP